MWSPCRTESAFCAIFGSSPKLACQNEPCLVEFGFQNVPVLVQKHTSHSSISVTGCFLRLNKPASDFSWGSSSNIHASGHTSAMSTNSSRWNLLIRLLGIGSIASPMNKPVGMLIGVSVMLCKVLVGGTCVGGTCVAVAWMSGGGLGSAIIGTMPISGWPMYGIQLLVIGSQCNILLRLSLFFCTILCILLYLCGAPCCYALVGHAACCFMLPCACCTTRAA